MMRIWALALLAITAAACSNGDTTPAPAAYSWTQLSTEYSKLLAQDCYAHSDFQMRATCLSMLKPEMESLRTAAQSLPMTKARTDLTLAVDKFLERLETFSKNGCFTRARAIECSTGPHLMATEHDIVKSYVQRGIEGS